MAALRTASALRQDLTDLTGWKRAYPSDFHVSLDFSFYICSVLNSNCVNCVSLKSSKFFTEETMTAVALLKHQSKILRGSMVMPLVCDQGQPLFIAVCASIEYSCKPVVFVEVLNVLRAGKQGKATRTFRRSIRSGKRGSWKEPGLPATSFSVLTSKTP